MIKLELNGDELLKIIEVCGKSGVTGLRLGKDLELTFVGTQKPNEVPVEAQANAPLESEIEKESFAKAQADLRKQSLEEMKLIDPVAYEKLVASGDLVDEETSQD